MSEERDTKVNDVEEGERGFVCALPLLLIACFYLIVLTSSVTVPFSVYGLWSNTTVCSWFGCLANSLLDMFRSSQITVLLDMLRS